MAQAREVAWSDAPDLERGVYYPILTPKPGKPLLGIVLSECLVGADTYFEPGKAPGERGHSLPCTCKPDRPCPGRLAKRDHRWKGYLACWDHVGGRLFLAEVTKEAFTRCGGFQTHAGRLRGLRLRLERAGEAPNSRVTCWLKEVGDDVAKLPPPFNVRSALERIWFGGEGPPIRHPGRKAVAAQDEAQDAKEAAHA